MVGCGEKQVHELHEFALIIYCGRKPFTHSTWGYSYSFETNQKRLRWRRFRGWGEQGGEWMVSITVDSIKNNSVRCKVFITGYSVVKERIEKTF